MSDIELTHLAARLGAALEPAGIKLVSAESCTGGWIAKVITDVAGSSAWFERGFITYSNAAKREVLGVNETILTQWGAVSEQTVREMAAGALRHSAAQVAVAVTGIAGPGGAGVEKPVGTVWFGWAWPDGRVTSLCRRFDGDREAVRRATVALALTELLHGFE